MYSRHRIDWSISHIIPVYDFDVRMETFHRVLARQLAKYVISPRSHVPGRPRRSSNIGQSYQPLIVATIRSTRNAIALKAKHEHPENIVSTRLWKTLRLKRPLFIFNEKKKGRWDGIYRLYSTRLWNNLLWQASHLQCPEMMSHRNIMPNDFYTGRPSK